MGRLVCLCACMTMPKLSGQMGKLQSFGDMLTLACMHRMCMPPYTPPTPGGCSDERTPIRAPL